MNILLSTLHPHGCFGVVGLWLSAFQLGAAWIKGEIVRDKLRSEKAPL